MVLASSHTSAVLHLETISFRLFTSTTNVLRLYNLSAEFKRSKTTISGNLTLLSLFIHSFKAAVKTFFQPCQGKVEMSYSWQSRNVRL